MIDDGEFCFLILGGEDREGGACSAQERSVGRQEKNTWKNIILGGVRLEKAGGGGAGGDRSVDL